MPYADPHPLAQELAERIRTDPAIFEFLERGCLDGLWFWDIENPAEEWLSPRFKEMFGYAEHEMAHGTEWWQANIHPDDLAAVIANFERHRDDPAHPYDQVVRYRHRDGHTVWIRCRGMMIRDEAGRPIRMLGAHTDVTALKETEAALERALAEAEAARAEAEGAARVKTEFLTYMSHEIRTPLAGITGMLDLLNQTRLDDAQHRNLAMARQCCQSLLAIVDGVLDLSQLHQRTLKLVERAFEGEMVFNAALSIMSSRAEARGLEFVSRIRPSACRSLKGDPDRITQIIYNLIGNAIKFTEAGRIDVVVNCADHPTEDDRLTLELGITDTGIGIAPEDQPRIFERFHRAEHERVRSQPGPGLGLSIVRELLDLMGGEIAVESSLGAGSTFTCRIPLRPAEMPIARSTQHAGPEDSDLAEFRVLVAEDNPGNREVVGGMLRALGCEFDLVTNGEEALERCAGWGYDLVLMDVQMPLLDGLSATRRIRADTQMPADLPIVALTANVMAEDLEACRRAGMTDHLGKPFTLRSLRRMLRRHLLSRAAPCGGAAGADPPGNQAADQAGDQAGAAGPAGAAASMRSDTAA
ncbi:hypothetical protein LNKW23_08700 [Paralimibaculum aggregatum]|uniref:histidine kinase n=1 Tax=Paralimibaculum aggregatum TaxID=3036245 RepID=A0ABQ6LF88_9RHOB|nr:PAS domain-containing hybrid sensor histidine kinase/response regulator [Limibaculum sp. NKW23]GMG81657.1 hypothetical protein LNKW23_08700 [Limibaculum sp. NKW23]